MNDAAKSRVTCDELFKSLFIRDVNLYGLDLMSLSLPAGESLGRMALWFTPSTEQQVCAHTNNIMIHGGTSLLELVVQAQR